MKNNRFYFLLCTLLLFPCLLSAQTELKTTVHPVDVTQWITNHFKKGVVPPFSFVYNGKSSKEFIRNWKYTSEILKGSEKNVAMYRYTYQDKATGLKVQCDVKGFTDYKAVEWLLHFTNEGTSNSSVLSDVHVSDISYNCNQPGNFKLYYAGGSQASKGDFCPYSKTFSLGDSLRMVPAEGRSSCLFLPFFNIESSAKQGVMFAIGWTGTWFSDIHYSSKQRLSVSTGIEHLKTFLYPKESIRTSSICMMFWYSANRMVGHNQFRHFILAHHTPLINGKPTIYPISTGFNWGDPAPCNEYSCLTSEFAIALVKRYKQFKLVPEVFWLDAGWYSHSGDYEHGKDWGNTVGYWTPDPIRFPQGLRPVSDEVHKAGAKFMVWFEPERVIKGTTWAEEHPKWMLHDKGENGTYLYNLGNPDACKWLCQYMGNFLQENGIDYYRQDCNIDLSAYWRDNDAPGRLGMCEVKYIEGLYTYWDYLLHRFPNLLIDNCASGGRRIDLETTSRSAPLWRTDYNYGEPVGYQCHTYGLQFYLPQHGTGTGLMGTDEFTFRSSLATSVVYNWKIAQFGFSILEMQARQAEFKEVRPYFYEDYYPLSGIDNITSEDIWLAYQLYRSSDDSGYIVAFRRQNNKDKEYTVKLSGVHADKVYTLTDKDSNATVKKTGKELIDGYTLTLENPRSSLLIKYQVVK
jgi:alpha-galactosidase